MTLHSLSSFPPPPTSAHGVLVQRSMGIAQNEVATVLRILHAIARADGVVNAEEERALTAFAENLGAEIDRESPFDIAIEAARLHSREGKLATFEAAVALAAVDGQCSLEEHAMLERLRDALGVEIALPLVAEEARWLEETRGARAALRAAEKEFMHALAAKQTTGVAPEEYRTMVNELHDAQVRALRETIDVLSR